jgi:hypothetical protein
MIYMICLKLLAALFTSVIAIGQALDKNRKVKILVILCVSFLFATTVILEVITNNEKENRGKKLDKVLESNNKLNGQVTALQGKLDPFIKFAEKLYPGLKEEDALKKLQTDIERIDARAKALEKKSSKLEEQLSNYYTYAEVATWNLLGGKMAGFGVEVNSPVSGWTKGYTRGEGRELEWKCDSSAIVHYKRIIEKQPLYPFTYYVLAICLKRLGDDSWKKYAKDGIQILEKTTTIPGHDPGHDAALKSMKGLFNDQ